MIASWDETLAIRESDDVVRVRQEVRKQAIAAGLGLVDQTKIRDLPQANWRATPSIMAAAAQRGSKHSPTRRGAACG